MTTASPPPQRGATVGHFPWDDVFGSPAFVTADIQKLLRQCSFSRTGPPDVPGVRVQTVETI